MSNVMPLTPPATGEAENVRYRRIRLGSRWLVVLFTGLAAAMAVLLAVLVAGVIAYKGQDYRIGPTGVFLLEQPPWPAGSVAMGSLPLAQRLAYAVIGAARMAPSLAILWGLRRLFSLYGRGVVFARENARQIGFIGVWLVVDAVTPFVEHLIQQALGYEIDHSWFHVISLQELVLGALVFVIAEVMRVGHEIEQDREAFV